MKSWLLHQSRAESVNRKIFRAAVIVGLLTLVVKVGATLKELVVARTFGRNDALDARTWNEMPGTSYLRQDNLGASLGGPLARQIGGA